MFLAVQQDLPVRRGSAVDHVVHAVEAAQEGRLAAARRADHGHDLVAGAVQGDVPEGLLVAIVDIDIAAGHARVVPEPLAHGGADRPGLAVASWLRRSRRRVPGEDGVAVTADPFLACGWGHIGGIRLSCICRLVFMCHTAGRASIVRPVARVHRGLLWCAIYFSCAGSSALAALTSVRNCQRSASGMGDRPFVGSDSRRPAQAFFAA